MLLLLGIPGVAPANLGVHVRPAVAAKWLERLGDVNADHFRANLRWKAVQPKSATQTYRWSQPDRLARLAAVNDVRWQPVIIGSPEWAAPVGAWPPRERWYGAYEAFVAQAVARYGPGGLFWLLNPGLPYRPVLAWEIHNEPNLPEYWRGDPNPREYADLVQLLGGAIHAAAPRTKALLAGMPVRRPDRFAYVRRVLHFDRARQNIDATTSHPYAESPLEAARLAQKVRALAPAKPHWVTEVGWATDGTSRFLRVQPSDQARMLRQVVGRFRERGIRDITWYSGWDLQRCGGAGEDHWCAFAGLRTTRDRPKPAWSVFEKLLR